MKPMTNELIQSALRKQLDAALESAGGSLTAEVAADARQAFLDAVDARDASTAMAAALVASRIYERLGDRPNQLVNLIDLVQVQFMAANTVEQYDTVRAGALRLLLLSDQASQPKLGFYSAVLAADAAYFAAASANDDRTWLKASLRDVVSAFDRAAAFRSDHYFVKLVDLAATVVNKVTTWYLFDPKEEEERRGLLHRLAAQVDDLVPTDFEYPGNPQQTAKIASIFGQLSDDYGVKP